MRRLSSLLLALVLLFPSPLLLTSCGEREPSTAPSYLEDYDWSTHPSALLREKVATIPKYYAVLSSPESINALNAVLAKIQNLETPVRPAEEAKLATALDEAIRNLEKRRCDVARISIHSEQEFAEFNTPDTYVAAEVHVLFGEGEEAKLVNETAARIKLHGNSSLLLDKKSLTIKLNKKQDLFGFGKSKTWFLISNAYDKTLMRNSLCYGFAADAGLSDSVECEYVEVWYNNTYLGCFLVTEKVESGEGRLPIDELAGDFLIEYEKNRTETDTSYVYSPRLGLRFAVIEPKEPTADQLTALRASLSNLEDRILAGDREALAEVCDVDSFVRFYITSELFKTVDFAFSSTKFYCKDGVWHAGPIWDYDLSAGNVIVNPETKYREYNNAEVDGRTYGDGSGDSTHGVWCDKLWFAPLLEHAWFDSAVKATYLSLQPEIVNLYADNERGASQIDVLLTRYGSAFDRNFVDAGWSLDRELVDRETDGTYLGSVSFLRRWLRDRNEWLLTHWGLAGD